jgi:hypothetical protein
MEKPVEMSPSFVMRITANLKAVPRSDRPVMDRIRPQIAASLQAITANYHAQWRSRTFCVETRGFSVAPPQVRWQLID